MERMEREIPKHCNDLDRIGALENENYRLEEENKKLKKELEQAIYWKVDYEKSYKQVEAKRDELLEENKKLKEENEIIMKNADAIAHHNVELMKKVKELEKKLGID